MTNVAVCQLELVFGDLDANREISRKSIVKAVESGAKVIVLPELSNSGYHFYDKAEAEKLAEPSEGDFVRMLLDLAAEHDIVIVSGFCEIDESGDVRNSAAVVDASGVRDIYRKTHLWDREALIFSPGNERPRVIDTKYGRIAALICYDLEFPEWVRIAATLGADLIAVPTNWPRSEVPAGERSFLVANAQVIAETNHVYVAVADRARSAEREHEFTAGSVIAGPEGYPVVPMLDGEHGQLLADCDLFATRDKAISPFNDVHGDRRLDLYV